MIRVLLVDDHPVVRDGVAAAVCADPSLEIVGQVGSGEQAINAAERCEPDVVLVDFRLGGMSGADATQALLARNPRLRVVVFSSFPSEAMMLAAFAAGARGFLVKESDPSMFRLAVRVVTDGGVFVDPRVASKLVALATRGKRRPGPLGLTRAELGVVGLLPERLTNAQIARHLGVSEHTVKTHLRSAMGKLGVHRRDDLAAVASERGLA